MRPKMIIKLEKNKTSNFDAIYFSEHEKIIDLHSEDKKNSLKKKSLFLGINLITLDLL